MPDDTILVPEPSEAFAHSLAGHWTRRNIVSGDETWTQVFGSASRSETIGTTNGSPNITGAAATFEEWDAGAEITGTGIPANTRILSVTSDTAAVMSANATNTGSPSAVIGIHGVYLTLSPGEAYLTPCPAGDFEVVVLHSREIPISGRMLGPLIVDASGNGVMGSWYSSPDTFLTLNVSAWGYGSAFTQGSGAMPASTTAVKLRKSGTNYYTSYSTNYGSSWSSETPALARAGITPTQMGFGMILGSAQPAKLHEFYPGPAEATSINLGLISETTTVHAVSAAVGQSVALGVVTETTTAHSLTITSGEAVVLGVVTETTTAHALGIVAGFVAGLGVVTETTTVHAVSAISPTVVTLGLVSETTSVWALTVDPGYTDTARNWTSGRQRDGIATWSRSPAVVDYPAHLSPAAAWVTAIAFDPPVVTNGRPIVSVTTATEIKTRHRITIGGVDVTFLYGVPTPEMDYQYVNPGLYGPGSLVLPQVYGYMETPGEGGLSWLTDYAPVIQERVNADGDVVGTEYKGFVLTYDIGDDGLRIECGGELTGKLALDEKQITLYRNVYDLGRQWYLMCKNHGVSARPVGGPATGIEALAEGGTSYLDAFNRINALAATQGGVQYTTMPDANGLYRFEPRDEVTIHATYYPHDGQQSASLRRDLAAEPNMIYGTGVAPNGMRVLNAIYPDLALNNLVPDYPKAGGASFGVGTTDAETVSGDGITVMVNALHRNGFLDAADAAGGYDDDVAEAIQEVQRRAGLAISLTGDMTQATWRALFDQDANGFSMRGSQILPMAQDPATVKYRRGASGAIIGRSDTYDPSVPQNALNQDFGIGLRKPQMLRHSRRKLNDSSTPNWVGEMTLETGALIAGEHTPGDPITSIMHDWEVKPGMNIWMPTFMGGIVVNVSGKGSSGGKHRVQVDSRYRDSITVAQIIARNREARRDLYGTWVRDHLSSGNISDANPEWSEAGGKINDVELTGDAWTVFPVPVGRSGTIGRLRLRTVAPTEFWMAIFGQGNKAILEAKLTRRIGDPSTEEGAENWINEDILDDLDQNNILLYVGGEPDAPCGYWPTPAYRIGQGAAILTGKHRDDEDIEYRTAATNVLWVAVFAKNNAKIPGGRIMWPKLEPM